MKSRFILLLLALSLLCTSVIAQMNANYWSWKGDTLFDQGKYYEAIQAFDNSIALNPEYEETWYNKGKVLFRLGKYNDSIKAYDKAIELDPKDAWIWNDKGDALFALGKYDESIIAYDEATKINVWVGWSGKASALRKLGRNEEADAALIVSSNKYAFHEGEKYDEAIKSYNKTVDCVNRGECKVIFFANGTYSINAKVDSYPLP